MPRSLLIEGHPCAFLWFKLLVTLDREERYKNQSRRKEEGGFSIFWSKKSRDQEEEASRASGETRVRWVWLWAEGEPPECVGGTEGAGSAGRAPAAGFWDVGRASSAWLMFPTRETGGASGHLPGLQWASLGKEDCYR